MSVQPLRGNETRQQSEQEADDSREPQQEQKFHQYPEFKPVGSLSDLYTAVRSYTARVYVAYPCAMCVHACGGQRTTPDAARNCPPCPGWQSPSFGRAGLAGYSESSRDPPTSYCWVYKSTAHAQPFFFFFFTRVLGIELRSPKLHPTCTRHSFSHAKGGNTHMRGIICLFIYSELTITWLYNCGTESILSSNLCFHTFGMKIINLC